MLMDLNAESLKDDQYDPQKISDAILEEAREKARNILEDARREAEKIKENASVEAEKKIREAQEKAATLLEEARKKGYEEGVRSAQEIVNLMRRAIEKYEKYLKDLEANALPVLLNLYKEVASKTLVDGLSQHENLIERVMRKVLDKLSSSRNVIFRVSLQDYDKHGKKMAELLSFIPDLTIRPDSSLKPGEILAETEFGMVDASPWRVVEEFKEAMEGLVNGVSNFGRDEVEDSTH